MMAGTVAALFTTPGQNQQMIAHDRIEAIAGAGLAGDRYALEAGYYSARPLPGGARELTLIEQEALDEIEAESGIRMTPNESRRNIVTQGVRLDDFIGKRFKVGVVLCEGVRECPPCVHLEQLTGKTVMKPMARRGGLRANILTGGFISVGDMIEEVVE